MRRSRIKFLAAVVLVAATTVPAFAQMSNDKPDLSRSDEAKQNDAAFDTQFRKRNYNAPAADAKADPWGGVRSEPAQPAAAKKSKANR